MPIAINFNGDVRLIDMLDQLDTSLSDFTEPFNEAGAMILEEVDQAFETEGSRAGNPWQELAEATIKQKIRLGYGSMGILERTGALRESFKFESEPMKLVVSSLSPIYRYHQLGEGNNPQRIMLKATENIKQNILEIIIKALKDIV